MKTQLIVLRIIFMCGFVCSDDSNNLTDGPGNKNPPVEQPLRDEGWLNLVQEKSFDYFYGFGHPTSGMPRERLTDLVTVATGDPGFGLMAIIWFEGCNQFV